MQFVSGLYSLLLALDFFEKQELYFYCHCIKEAIKRNADYLKCDFALRIEESDYNDLSSSKKLTYLDESVKIIERVIKKEQIAMKT